MDIVAISVISLGVIGAVSAVILYFIAQRFKVEEDPRIDEVESLLPGANCGGCGKAGCRNFAESCVKATSLDGLFCPVGGGEVMKKVAGVLGMEAADATPRVAVVRCNGTCENRPRVNIYEGAASCAIVNSLYGGETACRVSSISCRSVSALAAAVGARAAPASASTRPETSRQAAQNTNSLVFIEGLLSVAARRTGGWA